MGAAEGVPSDSCAPGAGGQAARSGPAEGLGWPSLGRGPSPALEEIRYLENSLGLGLG